MPTNASRLLSSRVATRIRFGSRPTILLKGPSNSAEKSDAGGSIRNLSTGTFKLEHSRPSTGVIFLKSPFKKRVILEGSIFAARAICAGGVDPIAIFNRRASRSTLTR